jgi:hypothetical protein
MMSLLNDFDLHLLAEGKHYRSYERPRGARASRPGEGVVRATPLVMK